MTTSVWGSSCRRGRRSEKGGSRTDWTLGGRRAEANQKAAKQADIQRQVVAPELAPKRPCYCLGSADPVGGVGVRVLVRILALEGGIVGGLLLVRVDHRGVIASRPRPCSLRAPDPDRILAGIAGPGMLGNQHPRPFKGGSTGPADATGHSTRGDGRNDRSRLGPVRGLEFGGEAH